MTNLISEKLDIVERDFETNLSNLLTQDRIQFNQSKGAAWSNIQERIDLSESISIEKIWGLRKWAAAAVLFLGVAMAAFFIGNKSIKPINTDFAQIELPDGSQVTIAEGSELKYNALMWYLNRDVSLSGKAFFEVEKGSTFRVETKQGDVTVLGTSFLVVSEGDSLVVSCKTGKVGVSQSGKIIEALTAGDKLVLTKAGVLKSKVPESGIDGWINSEFTFDNTSLREAIEIIALHFEYEVAVPEFVQLKYSGQISKNLSLEESMDILCLPFGINYSIDSENKLITITKI